MRLRNRKTGEIVDTKDYNFRIATPAEPLYGHDAFDVREEYNSLAELNEDWEDYTPAEPLIKDEKVRKAVRAWADAWNKNKLYKDADNALSTVDNFVIQFGQTAFIDLEEKKPYTIAELCGEEEE